MTLYKTVPLTDRASAELRKIAAKATGLAERRISQSDALIAAIAIARNHADEYAAILTVNDSMPAEDSKA